MWSPAYAGFLRSWALRGGREGGGTGDDDWCSRDSAGPRRQRPRQEGRGGNRAGQGEAEASSHAPPPQARAVRAAPLQRGGSLSFPCPAVARLVPGSPVPALGIWASRRLGLGGWGSPESSGSGWEGGSPAGRGSLGPFQKRFAGQV